MIRDPSPAPARVRTLSSKVGIVRNSIPVAIALAFLVGCAHKAKDAPSDATAAGVTQPAAQQATAAATRPPPPVDEGWPRTYASGETPTKIYQPQLESWDGFALKASAAVEVDPAGAEPVFGIAQLTASSGRGSRALGVAVGAGAAAVSPTTSAEAVSAADATRAA